MNYHVTGVRNLANYISAKVIIIVTFSIDKCI